MICHADLKMSSKPPYVCDVKAGDGGLYTGALQSPSYRIAIHHLDHKYVDNNLFKRCWIVNSGWCEAMISLHESALKRNIEIGTSDIVPLDEADLVIFINLPSSPAAVKEVRWRNPKAKLILLASESPVVQPHAALVQNHKLFDTVFSYFCPRHEKSSRYLFLPPGCGFIPAEPPPDISFHQRRFGVMVNSNVNTGLLRSPRPWHVLNQARAIRRRGWALPRRRQFHVARGSRYHCRRSFARAAQQLGIHDFEIYGQGWEPLRSGWYYRFRPERPWAQWRGLLREDKLQTLCKYRFAFCYENYSGDEGYISEKIFDALAAGTVPLCLGDRNLKRWIPGECAVFRDDYSSDKALLGDLLNWDEARWKDCRQAGQDFLHSKLFRPYLPVIFAEKVLDGLINVLQS